MGNIIQLPSTGLRFDLSNEEYHAGDGESKSKLDKVEKSPAHYFAAYIDPQRPPAPDPTPAMITGTLAHCAVLEPDQFDKRYAVAPSGIDRRTKEGKAAWEVFQAQAAGREVINAEQRAKAFAQAEAVRKLPDVAEALANGRPEVSAFWVDQTTGLLCKCRPDWVHDCGDAGDVLFDVKTTSDASPREFCRSIAKWRYHVQAAFYSDGYRQASGRDVLAFVFIAVENEWPHFCSALMIDEPSLIEGRAAYRRNLDTIARCKESGQWPSYSMAIETISLPAWAFSSEE